MELKTAFDYGDKVAYLKITDNTLLIRTGEIFNIHARLDDKHFTVSYEIDCGRDTDRIAEPFIAPNEEALRDKMAMLIHSAFSMRTAKHLNLPKTVIWITGRISSGKTTLARLIAGEAALDRGDSVELTLKLIKSLNRGCVVATQGVPTDEQLSELVDFDVHLVECHKFIKGRVK